MANSGESGLELLADAAVDEEVGAEVEHDEEVGHGLQAHHPHGGDELNLRLDTAHLHVWRENVDIGY